MEMTVSYSDKPCDVKIILLGDSAVGKSKLIERFLEKDFLPQQLSTYALTLYRYVYKDTKESKNILIDFWDTAGQERFSTMHPSYYHGAHACLLCFDLTRKITYKNCETWYQSMLQFRPNIPVLLLANKVDLDERQASKTFRFSDKHGLPLFFVSASTGTNVVAAFQAAIEKALEYKKTGKADFVEDVLNFIKEGEGMFPKDDDEDGKK